MPGLFEDDLEPEPEDVLDPDLEIVFDAFLVGTLAPYFLASDKPIAKACLREVTFLPEPVFNLPSFFSCIATSTFSPARFEYFTLFNKD